MIPAEAIRVINELVSTLREGPASREVSVAVTHLQTAVLWINEASTDTPLVLRN